jgi:glycerate 2-kinase
VINLVNLFMGSPFAMCEGAFYSRTEMADEARETLQRLFEAALEAVDPGRCVARGLESALVSRALRKVRGRIGIFAVGKAAAGMYRTASERFPHARGLVVLPAGYPAAGLGHEAEVRFASHPEPDGSSVAAARAALAFFRGFSGEDTIVVLVSGGASSLLCLPKPGISLAAKRSRVRELARSGASIAELNRLRTRLSAVKGGRLGRATRAGLVTLVLSDVPGDDPAMVGSGPTIRGRRGDVVRIVGSNASGLEAAAAAARGIGLAPVRVRGRLEGEAAEAGRRLARGVLRLAPGEVLLAGGETTVALGRPRSHGARALRGGRSLELALAAGLELSGSAAVLLAAASDGIDGSSGAAGAFVDGTTGRRAREAAASPTLDLARHDTAPLFEALGDLLVTGPTGTNVCDWVFGMRPV